MVLWRSRFGKCSHTSALSAELVVRIRPCPLALQQAGRRELLLLLMLLPLLRLSSSVSLARIERKVD
ncbi:hypothetical protein GGF41_001168 [Coemansia sp. RSA 2531]|nr:hypothetical protein GGF41_001168 [Coemansia sp. RSA 2531]